jgi:hypothetical protein
MKDLSESDFKLIREQAIREYRSKQEKNNFTHFVGKTKKMAPISIAIGLIACVFLVYVAGWKALWQLLLTGIIYVTLISAAVSAMAEK